jgi:DinB family protein
MTLITGETWGENVDGVHAFLLSEAERPLDDLRASLDTVRQEFRAALDGVSEAQGQFTPGSGEGEDAWGIAEVLRHIASVEPIMAERVRLLGSGQSADGITRTHPGYLTAVDTRQMADLRTLLAQTYQQMLDAIAVIAGHERLDTQAPHRRYGDLNCRGWVALHTMHLRDHTRQITRLKHLMSYPPA